MEHTVPPDFAQGQTFFFFYISDLQHGCNADKKTAFILKVVAWIKIVQIIL
jgi:hypothetical protein